MSNQLKLRFLGATGQVERSAILVSYNDSKILLDYGVQLSRPPLFPLHVAPRELSAIALSHAHLDHSGGSPFLYVSGTMNAYMTPPTLDLVDLLVRDFIKLSGAYLPYEFVDFLTMREKSLLKGYHEVFKVPGTAFKAEFLNSGHIPGGCQVVLDGGSRRILHTSDINSYETQLQPAAEIQYDGFDAVICECTYAGTVHPERKSHEKDFAEKVREVVEGGGVALIPTFAIGRSQEILMILYDQGFEHDIYIDGMAIKATEIILRHPSYVKDFKNLQKAYEQADKIYEWRERRRATAKPCAIVAPAGMLGGGAAVFYMKKLHDDEKNAIFVVGFQAPGTPGRTLIEEKRTFIRRREKKVRAEVYNFKFSSHIDHKGFRKLLSNVGEKAIILAVHGNPPNREALIQLASEEMGLEAYAPKMGEEFEI